MVREVESSTSSSLTGTTGALRVHDTHSSDERPSIPKRKSPVCRLEVVFEDQLIASPPFGLAGSLHFDAILGPIEQQGSQILRDALSLALGVRLPN